MSVVVSQMGARMHYAVPRILHEAGALVAYAQLREGPAPGCVTGPMPIEVQRFYVAAAWQGRGLAQRLMERVVATAQERRAETLWLGVWERNPRGIAFYRKCGYVDVGSQTFVVGTPAFDEVSTLAWQKRQSMPRPPTWCWWLNGTG